MKCEFKILSCWLFTSICFFCELHPTFQSLRVVSFRKYEKSKKTDTSKFEKIWRITCGIKHGTQWWAVKFTISTTITFNINPSQIFEHFNLKKRSIYGKNTLRELSTIFLFWALNRRTTDISANEERKRENRMIIERTNLRCATMTKYN